MLELVGLCWVVSFSLFSAESALTLILFSLVYSSLTFQLKGSSSRKLGLLALGNAVGLFWNAIFYNFATEGFALYGETFSAVYTILYPVLTLLWVVPFWSLSLTFLPRMDKPQANIEVEGR